MMLPTNKMIEARIARMCEKASTLRQATRIWNWIDGDQYEPEPLWAIMLQKCPWAFRDAGDSNSIRFDY